MAAPQFPAGPYEPQEYPDAHHRRVSIAEIEAAPAALRRAVAGLSDDQLDTRYKKPYYAWHCRHHTGQITWLREQNGW
ncbi:MAG: hypothetical protein ACRDGN_11765 [bacterium]